MAPRPRSPTPLRTPPEQISPVFPSPRKFCWKCLRLYMPEAPRKIRVQCEVNGRVMQFETSPMARLLDVLREQAHLTGTKEGCGEVHGGACRVENDAALVTSLLVP